MSAPLATDTPMEDQRRSDPGFPVPRLPELPDPGDPTPARRWSALVDVVTGAPAGPPTRIAWAHDGTDLVVDLVAELSTAEGGLALRSPFTRRNQPLWQADVLEIFLAPTENRSRYRELEAAPTGALFDAWIDNHTDLDDPDAERRLETRFAEVSNAGPSVSVLLDGRPPTGADLERLREGLTVDRWAARFRAPLEELGLAPGTPFHANAFRIQDRRGDRIHQAWAPTGRLDFHRPECFRRMVLST